MGEKTEAEKTGKQCNSCIYCIYSGNDQFLCKRFPPQVNTVVLPSKFQVGGMPSLEVRSISNWPVVSPNAVACGERCDNANKLSCQHLEDMPDANAES